jgi:hypothetical protein
MTDIMEGIGWWLRDHNHGLWARALQAQETVVVGWLLNSTREMDLVSLQAAMLATDPRLEVGLRWRLITLGQAGAIPVQQQVRAIHVEIDKLKVSEIKPILYRIYGPFPNGVRMRLVPEITPLMGPNLRAKADRLRNRQANFVQYSIKIANWEIATLDFVDTKMDASLRDLLMAIRARSCPQFPLIHSVDAQWQGNGYVITVIPDFQSEARTVLAGFLPFLAFHYPNHHERLDAMFTPAAVERAQLATWDPVSHSVITAEDGILANLEEVDADLDLNPNEVLVEGGPSASARDTPVRPDPGQLQGRTLYGGDTDSVSTINSRGTQHTNRRGCSTVNLQTGWQTPSNHHRSNSPSAATHQSSVSSMTIDERVASVENNVNWVLTILENMSMASQHNQNALSTPTLASNMTGAPPQDHLVWQPVVTAAWYRRRLHAGGRWPWSVTATAGVAVGRWRQQRRVPWGGGVIGGSHHGSRSNGLQPLSYSQAWGDVLQSPKPEHTLRICLQNVGGLPHTSSQIKNSQVFSFVNSTEVDILALTETNVCWRQLPVHDRLPERTRGWWESLHLLIGYYSGDSVRSALQPGGEVIFSVNQAAHRVQSSGSDPSGLGRWSWTRYLGRNQVTIRVIAAYRPVHNATGALSTYNRQRQFFYAHDDDRCPRQAFIDDLLQELQAWIDAGDQIVLAMDVNDPIVSCSLTTQIQQLGLKEIFLASHAGTPPPTYNRGVEAIDAIYVSQALVGCQCGYLAFGAAIPSDHRALWVDIPFQLAFGHHLPPVVFPHARCLKCQVPRIVRRYLQLFEEFAQRHQLPERAFALQEQCSYPLAPLHAAEWEAIDSLRVQGMLYAERRCRKLRMGGVLWSPEVQHNMDVILLWQLVCKRRKGVHVGSRVIQRLATKTGLPNAMSSSFEDALSSLRQAHRTYKASKRNAPSLRKTWLENLAQALSEEGNGDQATCLRSLQYREQQRSDARQIRRIALSSRGGGVTMVQSQSADGTWVEHSTPQVIEQACFAENAQRFRQANSTPFMVPPLSDDLGLYGIGPNADAILQGTYEIPTGTDYWAAELIRHLRMDERVAFSPSVSLTIPTQLHQMGWKRSRERTSSGPSGIHFGHFIAGSSHPLLADFDACMANIPYATGYAPLRWRRGTDVELLKTPGNYRVTEMRTIILYEADFNHNNKLLGRSMMSHAEELQQLAPEQYGSRKALSAIEQGLNKRFSLDIMRQQRLPGGLCINDAKSCYDRIVHCVATLAMRRLGVPKAPTCSMFEAIQRMRHHVRTAFGDSALTFGGRETDTPVHGVGQGNGAGPAIWAAVSTPVIEVMRNHGVGTEFVSALTGAIVKFVGYAFVDDTDLCHTARNATDSGAMVAQCLQEAVHCWAGTIRATGGAIVPHKSHWVLIDFKWKDGIWDYATIADTPAALEVRDSQGVLRQLERLEPSEARRTLGVRLAPDGNNRAEHEHLRSISEQWADYICTGFLPRPLVWTALMTTIFPKLRYPLPATTFSRKECKSILSPLLQAALPAAGICRNFPRVLVHAPVKFQGLGVPDLYTEQGIAHLFQCLQHAHQQSSITGQLFRASFEQLQLELGLPESPFSHAFKAFGHLATTSWVKALWQFLSDKDISLIGQVPTLSLRRENDHYLIHSFYAAGFRGASLQALNWCRLYLQATTLSDIVTGLGGSITHWAWVGQQSPVVHSLSYRWPAQQRPATCDWRIWQSALASTFGVVASTRTLATRLGAWLDADRPWYWFVSPTEERLYERRAQSWYFYPRSGGRPARGHTIRFLRQEFLVLTQTSLPGDLARTVVELQGDKFLSTGLARGMTILPLQDDPTGPPTLLASPHQSLLPHCHWLIASCDLTEQNSAGIAAALQVGRCIGVSDGSFKEKFGTASWVLLDPSTNCRLMGDLVVPGHPDDQNSYRSELAGIYAMVMILHNICQHFGITTGGVEIGCDGQEALYRCFSPVFHPTPSNPHYDLLAAVHTLRDQCSIQWSFRHVKGHQDNDPMAELDQWARLNIEMDLRAKAHWYDTHETSHDIQYSIPSEPWSVWIQGRKLCSDVRTDLLEYIHGREALTWWDKKGRFKTSTSANVDWEACAQAMRNATITRRHWIAKHAAGWCGVGKMMKLWQEWDTSDCPRCGAFEDAQHVWQCLAPSVTPVWERSLARLKAWMTSSGTMPGMRDAICFYLHSWRLGQDLLPVQTFSPLFGLRDAIDAQGWQAFFEGCLACDWAAIQHKYYVWIGSRRSGRRWVSMLIRKLWDTAWDLWEHRNGIVHERAVNSVSIRQTLTAIQHQLSLGPLTLAREDLPQFNRGRAVLESNQPELQAAWLHNVTIARDRAARRDVSTYRSERAGLSNWLQRGSITTG